MIFLRAGLSFVQQCSEALALACVRVSRVHARYQVGMQVATKVGKQHHGKIGELGCHPGAGHFCFQRKGVAQSIFSTETGGSEHCVPS